jgi:hypothetical protein
MRFDYLDRFAPLFREGFKRLREDGAVFSNARYRHASTETGPGHAVLGSGRHGRDTGIVANSWYDRLSRRMVNVVDDPVSAPVPGPGRAASPASFVGFSLGDLLKKASPGSRVVGVAMKDRAAILMTGHRADAAYWYEPAVGAFGTSTYYMRELPAWLKAWDAARPVDALFGRIWTRLLRDDELYRRLAGEDDVRGEWDGKDTTFPHRIRGGAPPDPEFYDEVRRTPFIDELTLDVALRAMEAHDLGTDEATDLLAVGFSATDVIGHTYGPDSQEIMDQLLRLDRLVGRLLEAAAARAGSGRLLVVLSSDHGAMPLVERLKARGVEARRASPHELQRAVEKALALRFPKARDLIAAFEAPNVYLDLASLERQGLERAQVEGVVEEALLASGIVQRVYTRSRLLEEAPADDPDLPLFRNTFFEPRSPHLLSRLKPYVYLDDYVGGTGHGTAEDYDRHVPVVFLGPPITAGRYEAPCGPEDIVPTLANFLGLDYPLEPEQRVLKEMMQQPPSSQ